MYQDPLRAERIISSSLSFRSLHPSPRVVRKLLKNSFELRSVFRWKVSDALFCSLFSKVAPGMPPEKSGIAGASAALVIGVNDIMTRMNNKRRSFISIRGNKN